MKMICKELTSAVVTGCMLAFAAVSTHAVDGKADEEFERLRVIMMSDFPPIGVVRSGNVPNTMKSDPDEMLSMVRFLLYANEFDIEGLIASAGCWKKNQSNTDMLDKIIDAYGKVLPNLQIHAKGFPSYEYLKSISVVGQTGYGMSDVGDGKDTKGSELIIASVDKEDPRPVWVQFWGGGNNLAQAIWKVKNTRSEEDFAKFVSKLRVFDILGQDDAGAWLAKTFPDLFYIRATGVYGWPASEKWFLSAYRHPKPRTVRSCLPGYKMGNGR